jgi:uncharacterized protein (TIGR04255 family)
MATYIKVSLLRKELIMALKFSKPPLVELVAELRWNIIPGDADNPLALNAIPFGMGDDAADEQLYMKFGAEIHQFGFRLAERLLPPGFPSPPGQVIWRYRSDTEKSHILQLGRGVFSANAVRPYSSWDEFKPCVDRGIDALQRARPEKDKSAKFSNVSLRYIDLFNADFLGDRNQVSFIREVLGFEMNLPDTVRKRIEKEDAARFTFSISSEIGEGLSMRLVVGEGNIGGELGVMLDTTVQSASPTDPSEVGEVLSKAHQMIHEMFVDLTRPISDLMGPSGAD